MGFKIFYIGGLIVMIGFINNQLILEYLESMILYVIGKIRWAKGVFCPIVNRIDTDEFSSYNILEQMGYKHFTCNYPMEVICKRWSECKRM